MKHLSALTKLTSLGLCTTKITDAGLEHLTRLKLTKLDLAATSITDAGVKHLIQLKGLAVLRLGDTRLTQTGFDAIRKALPKCKIVGQPIPQFVWAWSDALPLMAVVVECPRLPFPFRVMAAAVLSAWLP